MGRLIVLALAIAALVWLVKRARPSGDGAPADKERVAGPGPELLRCAHCGVHVPDGEAQTSDGRHYCSSEHARLGPARDAT